eukprot:5572301-Lingulodinium_polyedra.AAC.1
MRLTRVQHAKRRVPWQFRYGHFFPPAELAFSQGWPRTELGLSPAYVGAMGFYFAKLPSKKQARFLARK